MRIVEYFTSLTAVVVLFAFISYQCQAILQTTERDFSVSNNNVVLESTTGLLQSGETLAYCVDAYMTFPFYDSDNSLDSATAIRQTLISVINALVDDQIVQDELTAPLLVQPCRNVLDTCDNNTAPSYVDFKTRLYFAYDVDSTKVREAHRLLTDIKDELQLLGVGVSETLSTEFRLARLDFSYVDTCVMRSDLSPPPAVSAAPPSPPAIPIFVASQTTEWYLIFTRPEILIPSIIGIIFVLALLIVLFSYCNGERSQAVVSVIDAVIGTRKDDAKNVIVLPPMTTIEEATTKNATNNTTTTTKNTTTEKKDDS